MYVTVSLFLFQVFFPKALQKFDLRANFRPIIIVRSLFSPNQLFMSCIWNNTRLWLSWIVHKVLLNTDSNSFCSVSFSTLCNAVWKCVPVVLLYLSVVWGLVKLIRIFRKLWGISCLLPLCHFLKFLIHIFCCFQKQFDYDMKWL